MTSSNSNNDLVTSQEKLREIEWVTPKISLMDAEDTEGTKDNINFEGYNGGAFGPS